MLELFNSWYAEYLQRLGPLEAFALVIVVVLLGSVAITFAQARRH